MRSDAERERLRETFDQTAETYHQVRPDYPEALGAGLAAVARRNLAEFDVQVVQGRFEDWQRHDPVRLVYAATAWHWVDPAIRYQRAWDALRPGGHLALWAQAHVFPDGGDPFFDEIQDVYQEIGEGLPPDAVRLRPGELPDDREEIAATGCSRWSRCDSTAGTGSTTSTSTSGCSTRSPGIC